MTNKTTNSFLKIPGIFIGSALIFFFGCVLYPYNPTPFPEQSERNILIENINIVDVEADSILLNHHLLIVDGIIKEISEEPITTPDGSTKVLDGTNKYLLSGLWDMHVHLSKQSPFVAYPEFVRHGITHVRDMRGAYNDRDAFAGITAKLIDWNAQVQRNELLGPESHSYTSFAVEGPSPMFKSSPEFYNCATPEHAVELVKHFKESNINLIKVYNNIPPEAFFRLMQEAGKVGIDVAGHKPVRVSTIDASDAGMKSLEHGRFFIWDSYRQAEMIRNDPQPKSRDNTELRKRMLEEHDTLMLKDMFEAFVRNNTWYCPTHLTRKADAFADDLRFRERYKHIHPILRWLSFEDLDATLQEDTTAEGRKVYKAFYQKGLEISKQASEYGVKILAGSDVPELPGLSLHDELIELSSAGLAPFEVLRTATMYPAIYYGMAERYGSIKVGKVADLIILLENPVENVKHTRAIEGVIMRGTHMDSDFLAGLKTEVDQRRTGFVMTCKLVWDVLMYMTI